MNHALNNILNRKMRTLDFVLHFTTQKYTTHNTLYISETAEVSTGFSFHSSHFCNTEIRGLFFLQKSLHFAFIFGVVRMVQNHSEMEIACIRASVSVLCAHLVCRRHLQLYANSSGEKDQKLPIVSYSQPDLTNTNIYKCSPVFSPPELFHVLL